MAFYWLIVSLPQGLSNRLNHTVGFLSFKSGYSLAVHSFLFWIQPHQRVLNIRLGFRCPLPASKQHQPVVVQTGGQRKQRVRIVYVQIGGIQRMGINLFDIAALVNKNWTHKE